MTEYSDVSPSIRLELSLVRLRSEFMERHKTWKSHRPEVVAVRGEPSVPEVKPEPVLEVRPAPDMRSINIDPPLQPRSFGRVLTMLRNQWLSFRRT